MKNFTSNLDSLNQALAAAKTDKPADSSKETLTDMVSRVFQPHGGLAGAGGASLEKNNFHYEERPQQKEMALAIARSITVPEHLIVEAGTGVGKSFAYLAPLLYFAANNDKPVAISTYTINLQEQLIKRDIPFLMKRLGLDLKAVICKGRNNYLCLRRFNDPESAESDLFDRTQQETLQKIEEVLDEKSDLSIAKFDGSVSALSENLDAATITNVWRQIRAEYGGCLSRKCKFYQKCFYQRARAAALGADVLIMNHHLFFSNIALETSAKKEEQQQAESHLFRFGALVLDEAHDIESVASDYFGMRLTQREIEYCLRQLYVPPRSKSASKGTFSGKGLLADLKDEEGMTLACRAWDAATEFFDYTDMWMGADKKEKSRIVDQPLDFTEMLSESLFAIKQTLSRYTDRLELNDTLQARVSLAMNRISILREALLVFSKQALKDQVYWIESSLAGRNNQTVKYSWHSAPLDVAPLLKKNLFEKFKALILTSATLALGNNLEHFKRRIGGDALRELIVKSPFDYMNQMRVYVAADMPQPDQSEFPQALIANLQIILRERGGRAFVLFTNAQLMRDTAKKIQPFLANLDLPLFVQREGLSRDDMLRRFRESGRAVLFGLDSFWMGVDVQGDALSNVIITRLPFSPPTEPLTKARMDLLEKRGGNSFMQYSLPEAVLKFKQGVGRLIRSSTDKGIVIVLDSRIASKRYGQIFLRAIPQCPVEYNLNRINSGSTAL